MQYLETKQHYEDRYDLYTIEECLEQIRIIHKSSKEVRSDPKIKDYPESEIKRNMSLFLGRLLFVVKANRYKNRASTISEWMESDRVKQDKQDNASPPKINCPDCGASMVADDFRDLRAWPEDKPIRVLFILNCPKCKKHLGAYDDGEIYNSKPDLCPKCGKELVVKGSRKNKVITTLYKCKHCSYSKKDILDLKKNDEEHKKWQKEQNKKEQEGKKLLDKYREEFCLSDKKGKEYVETLEAMEVANAVFDEEVKDHDNPVYTRLLQLKKTKITDLEKLLSKNIKKYKFINLSFDKPEIDRYVIVSFTVQDINSSRKELGSCSDFKKVINKTLEDTNWRLLANDISYRLGYLKGQLKGYESEEDMLNLAGKKEKKEKKNSKSNIGDEKKNKYAHHDLVQLARLLGEQQAIENIRKRKLIKEPEGFFLESTESSYTCGICGEQHYGEDIWWRSDGLRCRDCWRNIKEGVIPMFDLDAEWWEKEFIKEWEISSEYSIHPSTRKKFERQGILKGRNLKNENGNIYCTIYLISENEGFLKSYPKTPNKDVNLTWSEKDKVWLLSVKKKEKNKN